MLTRYTYGEDGRPHRQALIYTVKEHGIKRTKIDSDALKIIDRLNSYGFKAYIVGGAVRDLLLKQQPKDYDIVTDAIPAKIKKIFHNSRIIGKRFRLVHVFFGLKIFEVSTFRSSVNGSVGNIFGTIDEDVKRRDFTLNALYYDTNKEMIVDYVGGVRDIKNNTLRAVIPLETIFVEDPVRMLRGIKYAASNNLKVSHSLKHRIKKDSHLLNPVSPSRLTDEIIKILNTGKASIILPKIDDYNLFMSLQPGAANLIDNSKKFKQKYFLAIKELDFIVSKGETVRLGRKLVALIETFIETLGLTPETKIENGIYQYTYHECRQFVLPMNPPRCELEYAVSFCLKKLNLPFKMPKHTTRRPQHTKISFSRLLDKESVAYIPSVKGNEKAFV